MVAEPATIRLVRAQRVARSTSGGGHCRRIQGVEVKLLRRRGSTRQIASYEVNIKTAEAQTLALRFIAQPPQHHWRRFHTTKMQTSAAPNTPPMTKLRCSVSRLCCSLSSFSALALESILTKIKTLAHAAVASTEASSSGYKSGCSSCCSCTGEQASRVACHIDYVTPAHSSERAATATRRLPPEQRHR